jgi:hypothetical protein
MQAEDPKAEYPAMTTLGFVRGTGVRRSGYDVTLAVIRELVAHRPDVWVSERR